jgi:hypothetical protein
MATSFEFNPDAAALHDKGLEIATTSADLCDAIHVLINARDIVRGQINPTEADLQVQLAGIERDLGFTFVRVGLQDAMTDGATLAMHAFDAGRDSLIGALKREFEVSDLVSDAVQRAELTSEEGATVTLLARFGTVKRVLGLCDEDTETTQNRYSEAAERLEAGSNRYYEVSNAANAARDARLGGRASAVSRWLGVGVKATLRAAAHDRGNFIPSGGAIAHRTPTLLSRSRTERSIIARP